MVQKSGSVTEVQGSFESRLETFLAHAAKLLTTDDQRQIGSEVLEHIFQDQHMKFARDEWKDTAALAKRLTPSIQKKYPTYQSNHGYPDYEVGDPLAVFASALRHEGHSPEKSPFKRIKLTAPLFEARHSDINVDATY